MSDQDVRHALAEALSALPNVNVFDTVPDTLNPPAVLVGNQLDMNAADDLGNLYRRLYPITIVVGRTGEHEAQQRLASLQMAVVAVLLTLERRELCHLHLRRQGALRPLQVAGANYWASDIVMEVWA